LLILNSGLNGPKFTLPSAVAKISLGAPKYKMGHMTLTTPFLRVIFIFSLFFVSGPCARLSWPFPQLLSARTSTVSYRVVFVIITLWLDKAYTCVQNLTTLASIVPEIWFVSTKM